MLGRAARARLGTSQICILLRNRILHPDQFLRICGVLVVLSGDVWKLERVRKEGVVTTPLAGLFPSPAKLDFQTNTTILVAFLSMLDVIYATHALSELTACGMDTG